VIAGSVLRALSRSSSWSRELADDLIQEAFLKLCSDDFRALRNFRRAGEDAALRGYLRVIATNIVVDHFRSGGAAPRVDIEAVSSVLASDDKTTERLEREALLKAVEKCLSVEVPRDHQIFWLYHRQGLRPKEIAAIPGIGLGMGGVETSVYKTTLRVRDCLRRAGVLNPPISPRVAATKTAIAEGGRS
jgi:RNA polymerase sigma-70 factor (ECF subfamily)